MWELATFESLIIKPKEKLVVLQFVSAVSMSFAILFFAVLMFWNLKQKERQTIQKYIFLRILFIHDYLFYAYVNPIYK